MSYQNGEIFGLLRKIQKDPEIKLSRFMAEADEDKKKALQEEFKSAIFFFDLTNILTDTGVVTEQSFLREFLYRINRQFFPPIYPDQEFRSFLQSVNSSVDFSNTIFKISTPKLADFFDWLFEYEPQVTNRLESKLVEPIRISVARLVYYGTSRQISSRLTNKTQLRESFLDVEELSASLIKNPCEDTFYELARALDRCSSACEFIRSNKSIEGISLDLTYRIIVIQDLVFRIQELCQLVTFLPGKRRSILAAELIHNILYSEKKSKKISTLFFQYIELVFYQITEHTGKAGESYIKEDSVGYNEMLKKGLIGGFIVGALSFLKPLVQGWDLPLFMEAVGYSTVYSGIFLLIYFLKGVLATKQPAMTASKIASELDKNETSVSFLWNLSELIKNTFRTQFIAIFGNFIIALPVAGGVYALLGRFNILTFADETSTYLLGSLHPLFSFTFFYAFLTGICLAMSGIFAGAFRNWYVFQHIDQRLIRSVKQYNLMSQQRISNWVKKLDVHLEGLVGNISLGFLLGFLSVGGKLLGLPLDVRHITFASAQAGTGLVHFIENFDWFTFMWLTVSILLIGMINLSVSFGITFFVVFKSRKMTFNQGSKLLRICLKRFFKEPLSFFFPVERKGTNFKG